MERQICEFFMECTTAPGIPFVFTNSRISSLSLLSLSLNHNPLSISIRKKQNSSRQVKNPASHHSPDNTSTMHNRRYSLNRLYRSIENLIIKEMPEAVNPIAYHQMTQPTITNNYIGRNAPGFCHSSRSPLNLTLSSTIICPSSDSATLNRSNGLGAGPSIFTPSGVNPLP